VAEQSTARRAPGRRRARHGEVVRAVAAVSPPAQAIRHAASADHHMGADRASSAAVPATAGRTRAIAARRRRSRFRPARAALRAPPRMPRRCAAARRRRGRMPARPQGALAGAKRVVPVPHGTWPQGPVSARDAGPATAVNATSAYQLAHGPRATRETQRRCTRRPRPCAPACAGSPSPSNPQNSGLPHCPPLRHIASKAPPPRSSRSLPRHPATAGVPASSAVRPAQAQRQEGRGAEGR